MGKTSVTMQVENYEKLLGQIRDMKDKGRKVISYTVKDIKKNAPSWIAQEVATVYNFKKSEITPSRSGKPKKLAGSIRISGETVESISITYEGRLLTPVHFGMKPKKPYAGGKSYELTMEVIKGQRKIIGRYLKTRTPGGPYSERSHNILMGTGNTKEGGVSHIPFQRMSKNRADLKKFTVISVPQMITSERTSEKIMQRLQTEANKALKHQFERFIK